MSRQIANNPSGKYIRMTDEEAARVKAALDRAVARQAAKDEQRAIEGRRITADIARQGWAWMTVNGQRIKVVGLKTRKEVVP